MTKERKQVHSSPRMANARDGGAGSERTDIGVTTQEFVNTPYGIGRIIYPHDPRTDGIAIVQLEWAILYASEDALTRIYDYQQQKLEHKSRLSSHLSQSDLLEDNDPSHKKKTKIKFPEFAPLNVPLARRRQTLALAVSSFWALICVLFSLWCIRGPAYIMYPFLAYVCWVLLFQEYHKNGRGFKSDRFRRLKWWVWFRDYFPISLHRTAPLDQKGKYIFCYHPHGILSLGAFLNFGSEATDFAGKFPGINLNVLTLTSNFKIPFYGFFLSMMGIADASRESCNACLGRGPGSAILLVLGGAKESLDAHPHRDYELTLFRKGYVKVALENQADLVPVFSFGETDAWNQVENPRGSVLRKIQEKMQQKLGFAIPLAHGRGIFMYNFGLLPHRRPISTFVGPALVLPKVKKEEINDDLIAECHNKYKAALEELFNQYKGTFAPHRKLRFVNEPPGSRGTRAKTD